MKIRRYPWDKWFNKGEFTLKRGRDFDCQVHGMAVQVRNMARSRGYLASLKIKEEVIKVTLYLP